VAEPDNTAGRLAEARRRAGTAKRTLILLSAAGFIAVLGLARASHPGHAASSSTTSSGVTLAPTTISSSDGAGADVQTHAS
jgi:hypothetical protein